MTDLVAINGDIFKAESAQIPAFDRAFLFGDGLLETMTALGPRVIDYDAHLQRLRRSAEACHINIPWSDAFLQFEIENLLSLTRFSRSSIRLIISRGISSHPMLTGSESAQRYIFCAAATRDENLMENGVRLKLRKDPLGRRGEQMKSPFYLPTVSAQLESKKEGFDDILWINNDGEVTESGFSNIFLMARDGDLLEIATPPLTAGILPGITRARVIELLERSQIPVTVRAIATDELPRFDEGFLSSSVRGLVPIQTIEKHRLHSLRPQAVFKQIQRLYCTWEAEEGGTLSSGAIQH